MLTLPNFLTLLRIVAIPLFLVLLAGNHPGAAFVVFLLAGVTDAVDGAVARLTDSRSELGAVLDPLADKLLLLSSFLLLSVLDAVPVWLVVLVFSRDAIVLAGYLVLYLVHGEAMEVQPSRLGKVNTFFELFTVGFAVMHLARPALPLVVVKESIQILTGITTAWSGVQYVYRGLLWHQQRSETDPQGPAQPGPTAGGRA